MDINILEPKALIVDDKADRTVGRLFAKPISEVILPCFEEGIEVSG